MSETTELNVQAINEIALGTKRLMATVDGVIVRMDLMEKAHENVKQFITRQEQINKRLETSITLSRSEQKRARTKTAIRIFGLLKLPEDRNTWSAKDHDDYNACFGRLRAKLYSDIHKKFDVASYTEVPKMDAEILYGYIDEWYPTEDLAQFKEWCYEQVKSKNRLEN